MKRILFISFAVALGLNLSAQDECGPGTIWDAETSNCIPDPENCGAGTYWNYLEFQCLPFDNCPEDLDIDGQVGVSDLLLLLSAYGDACPFIEGCTDSLACNFYPESNLDDGSCEYGEYFVQDCWCWYSCGDDVTDGTGGCDSMGNSGCTDPEACNYSENACDDDNSCDFAPVYFDCDGNCLVDVDGDGICDELEVLGCTDQAACNFNYNATDEDDSCGFPPEGYDCEGNCLFDTDGDTVCDPFEVFGCSDAVACNYEATTTEDDGSCEYASEYYDCEGTCLNDTDGDGICENDEIFGCTNLDASNYSQGATEDDGSCQIFDCIFENACNYNSDATNDDGSCFFYCPGCTDPEACNYDPSAIQDNTSCVYPVDLYDLENVDCEGSCLHDEDGDGVCDEDEVAGCTDPIACNYLSLATDQQIPCEFPDEGYSCDGECLLDDDNDGICNVFDDCPLDAENDSDGDGICADDEVEGCTDELACNFNPLATDEDESCISPETVCGELYLDCECICLNDVDGDGVCDEIEILGCSDTDACNYFEDTTEEDGSCEYESCLGCMYEFACNYDPEATIANNETCQFGTCPGCTDPSACNYNPTVNEEDGSCTYDAWNFDCDGNCIWPFQGFFPGCGEEGCIDPIACNYNVNASFSNESCDYSCLVNGCSDALACNFDASVELDDGSCDYSCLLNGCTDVLACNYDQVAEWNDGTCLYGEEANTSCNDQNPNTLNDVWSSDGCVCEGTPYVAEDGSGPCQGESIVSYNDYDYKIVEIGEQCWFAENLATIKYANGDSIPGELSGAEWAATYAGARSFYGEGISVDSVYNGLLYNWYAVDDERGLCPSGWHVPTDLNFIHLEMGLGMSESEANGTYDTDPYRGMDQCPKMKSSSDDTPPWDGTNSSGFSGLNAGLRAYMDGSFAYEDLAFFWTASSIDTLNQTGAWFRGLLSGESCTILRNADFAPRNGRSVRCVKSNCASGHGCTDIFACNYCSEAFMDDNSCEYMNECGACGQDPGFCPGCTDPSACNYDAEATIDDGSCIYTSLISFAVLTDDYPGETTWSIQDEAGVTVDSGGPYNSSGTTYTETICISAGCYALTVFDSYGDGICCDYGEGGYQLIDADGVLLVSGGNFEYSETSTFCVE